MAPERRRLALLLGLLGVVMVGAAYWLWPGASTAVSAAIGPRSGGRAPAAQTPWPLQVPHALQAPQPQLAVQVRVRV